MSLVFWIFSQPYIPPAPPEPQTYEYEVSRLRYDDLGLIELIHTYLVSKKLTNKKVLDGFLDGLDLTIPTVTVDWDYSDHDIDLELCGGQEIYREYLVEIFEETKGRKSDILECLFELEGRSFVTDDDRLNYITSIETLDDITTFDFLVNKHQQYFYLNLDGNTGYINCGQVSELQEDLFTVDLDLSINSDGIIYDTFIAETGNYRGLKIELVGTNLFVTLGQGQNMRLATILYNNFLGVRHRLTVTYTLVGTRIGLTIYRNSVRVYQTNQFIFWAINPSEKNALIGCEEDINLGTLDNFCDLDIYGIRLDNTYTTSQSTQNGENLPLTNNDVFYGYIDEGINGTLFNSIESLPISLTANGTYTWVKYLENFLKGYNFYYTKLRFKTMGIRRN